MEKIKVSVIVPVWGVEKYIERCARRLFEQTLEEMEFIFVDDCSPDRSIEILHKVIDDYPNRKSNVLILHHNENLGLPTARRTGLKHAKGEFIAHHDSDDWVDEDTYKVMYNAAIDNNADVVVCPFYESDGINPPKELKWFPKTSNGVLSNRLSSWELAGSLCNKIFKREIYQNDITFPTGNMAEDKCVVYQLIYYCNSIATVTNVHYYIFKNQSSITRVPTQSNIYNNFLQGYDNCRIVETFYKNKGNVDSDTKRALLRLKYTTREILLPIVHIGKYHRIWCQTFPEIDNSILRNNGISFKKKTKSLMIRFHLFPFPWKKAYLN